MKYVEIIARLSSFILHPIFYLVLNLFLLMSVKPHWFGVNHWSDKTLLLILVSIYSIVIPGIAILMLKILGVVKTLEMKEKHERIIPLIICMIFYLWLWINLKQDLNIPAVWIMFILCSVITTGLSLVINNWIKLSIHTAGITATLLFWVMMNFQYCKESNCYINFAKNSTSQFKLEYFLMILTFLGGWIMTARLILEQHKVKEIVSGIFIGLIGIVAAYKIVIL